MAKKGKQKKGKRPEGNAAVGKGKAHKQHAAGGSKRPPPSPRPRGGVPPLDAFDNLPRRSPPNLPGQPGYAEDIAGAQAVARGTTTAQHGAKKRPGGQPAQRNRRPAQSAPSGKSSKARTKQGDRRVVSPRKTRRRRKAISTILFLLVVLGIVTGLGAALLKVNNFVVEGESPYSDEEILAAFGHQEGENLLFSINAKREAEQLQQRLPYLEKVSIHRRPLDTILLRVSTAREMYYMDFEGACVVLSDSRKVLRISETPPDGLIYLKGVAEAVAVPGQVLQLSDEEQAMSLDALLAALDKHAITNVSEIDVADKIGMSFLWDGRFKIVVGSRSNLDAKLEYVFVLINDTAQSRFTSADRGTIDVSGYPGVPNAVYSPA